jgi:hypothetical protein
MGPTPIPNITGGAGGAAGPSTADLHGGNASFDSSNWTVATSGSRAAGGLDGTTLAIAAGVALLAMVLWKKLS